MAIGGALVPFDVRGRVQRLWLQGNSRVGRRNEGRGGEGRGGERREEEGSGECRRDVHDKNKILAFLTGVPWVGG